MGSSCRALAAGLYSESASVASEPAATPMKLIVTADLHYDIARSVEPTRRLAADVCRLSADALTIVGDSFAHDLGILRQCLALFDAFPGPRMLVAGNHDLWTGGDDSLVRYESDILDICRQVGVHYLDHEPLILDKVGFVGSVGWYDYTFRSASLGIPLRFYQHKVAPGAAARLAQYHHLIDGQDDLTDQMLAVTTRWMDGANVHLPISDLDFTRRLIEKLADHIRQVDDRCEQIVAAVHHLPFHQLVVSKGKPNWDFANAFMGSELFGDLLLESPKVRHVFCGHSHQTGRIQLNQLSVINVGSTYVKKRYETLTV
jgi:predicted phosphohydrolase